MATKYFSIAKPGIGNVGSFQVSGYPYITGSTSIPGPGEHKIEFPRVAKSVTIINKDTPDLRIHFNSTSSGNVYDGGHYITLATTNDTVTFNIKCKEIYISNSGSVSGSYELFAELTGIEPVEMPTLTGSGLTE